MDAVYPVYLVRIARRFTDLIAKSTLAEKLFAKRRQMQSRYACHAYTDTDLDFWIED